MAVVRNAREAQGLMRGEIALRNSTPFRGLIVWRASPKLSATFVVTSPVAAWVPVDSRNFSQMIRFCFDLRISLRLYVEPRHRLYRNLAENGLVR